MGLQRALRLFCIMASNCILGRIWVGSISVFVELFESWYIFVIVLNGLLYCCICLDKQWSSKRTVFWISHHDVSIILSLLFCYDQRHESIILGMILMKSLVLDRICIDTFDLYFYTHVDVDLVKYCDERYCQSFC